MQNVTLVLSFDHELSLGGAHSYERNLFEPTARLLDLAKEIRVPICLLTDILSAVRFEAWDRIGFYEPYCRQLHRALREGNEVQLHLHPHWLDVQLDGRRFVLGQRYSLSDFHDEAPPRDIAGIVRLGAEALTQICRQADPRWECVAFRAGGYALGRHADRVLRALWENGVRVESSVAKGYFLKTRDSHVDFRQMPAQANWWIDPAGPLDRPGTQGFFEVPIVAIPRNPWNNVPFLVKRLLHRGRYFDSGGMGFHDARGQAWDKLGRLFPFSAWHLSFDYHTHSARGLLRILEGHLRAHAHDADVYGAAIGHPKSMGPYQRQLMREFVGLARDRFGERLRFATYQQVYQAVAGS
jgi:hypothetical protein